MERKKRILDLFLTVPVSLLLTPLFLILCIWIRLDSPGPVFFRQKRVGIHQTHFEILKFRTMRSDTPKDVPTHLLKDPEQYITRAGRFLRKTSLDELPQLWNILKGDMSIAGPRPALWNQYDLLREREKYGANDVLPGLTGWAQIHGRDTISIPEKARLDGYYVAHQGIRMDLKCIFLTVAAVLQHRGVQEGGTGAEGSREENGTAVGREFFGDDDGETGGERDTLPLVSVVIATHRRKRELKRALASVFRQTYPNLEILLVDDNSDEKWNQWTERTAARGAASSGRPVHYIRNEKNLGSAASRNRGICQARGAYITFLDDDDVYLPEKVECQVTAMRREEADYSIMDLALYREDGTLEERRRRRYLEGICWEDTGRLLACHLMYHMTGTDTLMFRKSYLRKIGGFPPMDVGDEFYLMMEAIQGGGRGAYVPECMVKALVHTSTEGLSSRQGKIRGENALYEYKKKYFPELSSRAVRYIAMRHHLVLAYAHLRQKSYGKFLGEGFRAVRSAPIACGMLVLKRKG